MLAHSLIVTGIVALGCIVLVQANQYEQQQQPQTYNDGYNEEPAMPAYQQPNQYKQQQSYQAAQTYSAPSYPKYQAPSSAHHSQYDNYYPKQSNYEASYSAPAPTKPQYAPMPQMYQQQQQQQQPYPARGPTGYPSAPSANQYSMAPAEEY